MQLDYQPVRISLYKNGDKHFKGYQVIITHKNFKNWEQFLMYISTHLNLQSGAVRKIFTLEGNLVNRLSEFENEFSYVCSGGEPFISMDYLWKPEIKTDRVIVKREKEIPFFEQDSKSLTVYAVLNESVDVAKKIILNYRNCKNISQLCNLLTKSLGAIEPISLLIDYALKAKILEMGQLHDNIFIIGCTRHFVDSQYKFPQLIEQAVDQSKKIVTVFPNGDSFHVGIRITVTHQKFKSLEKFLEVIGGQLRDKVSKANILYGFLPAMSSSEKMNTAKGVAFLPKHIFKVKELSELVDGHYYVVGSTDEPFRNIRYNIDSIESGLKNKLLAKQKSLNASQLTQDNVVITPQFDLNITFGQKNQSELCKEIPVNDAEPTTLSENQ
eukprot:NODE_804_length_3799_cov_0.577297.p1 type:complete len:384 gc:universal NODE_804_length_3799_cov_0.577297:2109-958(-)